MYYCNHILFVKGFRSFTVISRLLSIQTASKSGIDKSLLKELRQKTGFSFSKCNEALKIYNNNVAEAEQWLHVQAEKEGWDKALKLQGRSTDQGLVGVLARDNCVAIVELACETDFVARNEIFKELVATTAEVTVQFRKKVILQNQSINSFNDGNVTHLREVLMTHDLEQLKVEKTQSTLQEFIVSAVGKIGENIKLKRALSMATEAENIIGTAVHGNNSASLGNCLVGNFAAIVVLKGDSSKHADLPELAKNICRHVIGMNPSALQPNQNVDKDNALLTQEYLLNDKLTVRELLDQSDAQCIDFVRYAVNQ